MEDQRVHTKSNASTTANAETMAKSSSVEISDQDIEYPPEVQTRSCCGCCFFLFVLWIWGSVSIGLYLNEYATRPIKVTPDYSTILKCGWQSKYYVGADRVTVRESYSSGSIAKDAGMKCLILSIMASPFLIALTFSCCVRNGTKDEEPEGGFHPNDIDGKQERWQRSQRKWNIVNRLLKGFGMAGTFVFQIAAYTSFTDGARKDCTSLPSNVTTTSNDVGVGRTLQLMLSAVIIAAFLIIIVIALIVLMTSENADQLGFVGAIASTMQCIGCDQGCPECAGGLECGDADASELCENGCDCCCCCCPS